MVAAAAVVLAFAAVHAVTIGQTHLLLLCSFFLVGAVGVGYGVFACHHFTTSPTYAGSIPPPTLKKVDRTGLCWN